MLQTPLFQSCCAKTMAACYINRVIFTYLLHVQKN